MKGRVGGGEDCVEGSGRGVVVEVGLSLLFDYFGRDLDGVGSYFVEIGCCYVCECFI